MYGAVCIRQNHCLKKLYLIMISSTSLPGGNQVDGLPPVSSFEGKFFILRDVLCIRFAVWDFFIKFE